MTQTNGNPGSAGGATGAEAELKTGSFISEDTKSARKSNRQTARALAASAAYRAADDQLHLITDRTALRALEAGFLAMLDAGTRATVIALTGPEGAALDATTIRPTGARAWLATGPDRDGRAAYAVVWTVRPPRMTAATEADLAEIEALRRLALICNERGWPMAAGSAA
jgi:hypothetical protein